MSLEFIILPVSEEYEKHSINILHSINTAYKNKFYCKIDTNYNSPLTSKVMSYRKKDKDVIIVDGNYIKNNTLTIRFCDKGSRPEFMSLDDFIELIKHFDDNETYTNLDKSEYIETNTNTNNLDSNILTSEKPNQDETESTIDCIIM